MRRRKPRRVAPQLALALLEGLRAADSPEEYLEDENTSATLPRRLGLSDVIRNEIQRYQEEARKGRRVLESQVGDLVGLVIKRGDADEVFRQVGRSLADASRRSGMARGWLPASMKLALARRAMSKRMRTYFGDAFVSFTDADFEMQGTQVPFLDADPGAEVCEIVSGLCEGVLEEYTGEPARLEYDVIDSGSGTVRWRRRSATPSGTILAETS